MKGDSDTGIWSFWFRLDVGYWINGVKKERKTSTCWWSAEVRLEGGVFLDGHGWGWIM